MQFLQISFLTAFLFFYGNTLALKAAGPSREYINDLGVFPLDDSSCWMNMSTVVSINGERFSRTDNAHRFGLGWHSSMPVGNGIRPVDCKISFRLRADKVRPDIQLVMIIYEGGRQVYWNGISLSSQMDTADAWKTIGLQELNVPALYTGSSFTVSFYVWNNDPIAVADIDDFDLVLNEGSAPSFLPPIPDRKKIDAGEFYEIASTPGCSIRYDKVNGSIRFLDGSGNILWDDFRLVTQAEASEEPKWSETLSYVGDTLEEDYRTLMFSFRNQRDARLSFRIRNDGGEVGVRYASIVADPSELFRQTIVFRSGLELGAVFFPPCKMQQSAFFEEYWLGKQGLTWTSAAGDWSLYRPEKVSSIQYRTDSHTCWINIDYAADHPLLQWPLEKRSKNRFVDASCSRFSRGDSLSADFTLFRLSSRMQLPRLLVPPDGRRAVFILTEHADYTSMRSQRAVEFGYDTATASTATRGLYGRKIPTTKSVFYYNPDRVTNAERSGFEKGPICTVKENLGFTEFLAELEAQGTEIALHTPEHFTSREGAVGRSLKELADRFGTCTWIDHGYDNAPTSNREDIVCDGLDAGSRNYVVDEFRRSGIKNVWNGFYEDSSFYATVRFNSELVVPHPAFGPSYPRPDRWVHPTRSEKIVHFRTTATLDLPDGSMWDYYLGAARLDFLVRSGSTFIGHYYPARIDSTNGFYDWRGKVWSIDPGFDAALDRIAKLRDQGALWVATIRDYIDRSQAMDSVILRPHGGDGFFLQNKSAGTIKGLTVLLPSEVSYSVSIPFKERKTDGQSYLTFDLAPDESVIISTSIR